MLNSAQKGKYWRAWSPCYKAFRANGKPAKEVNEMRHVLHERALGYKVSHKDMTNAEFDLVLAIFKAYSENPDLSGQMDQFDQPILRCKYCVNNYLEDMGIEEWGREAYLEKMTLRICKKFPDECDLKDWSKIIAALNYTTGRSRRRKKKSVKKNLVNKQL